MNVKNIFFTSYNDTCQYPHCLYHNSTPPLRVSSFRSKVEFTLSKIRIDPYRPPVLYLSLSNHSINDLIEFVLFHHRDRRDGLSKEGCGRVAILKYTGLIRSYTLECNYNTGCIVNIIPPTQRPVGKHLVQPILVPPKYTPQIYEEVRIRILAVTSTRTLDSLPYYRSAEPFVSRFST